MNRKPDQYNFEDFREILAKLEKFRVAELKELLSGYTISTHQPKYVLKTFVYDIVQGYRSTAYSEDQRMKLISKIREIYDKNFVLPITSNDTTIKMIPMPSTSATTSTRVINPVAAASSNIQNKIISPPTTTTNLTNLVKLIRSDKLRLPVKLKSLPFYDWMGDVMQPTILLPPSIKTQNQCKLFTFFLTEHQTELIRKYSSIINSRYQVHNVQVQLRFCLLDSSTEQEDAFPLDLSLRVNSRVVNLPPPLPCRPGATLKYIPKPFDITPLVKVQPLIPNSIEVRWTHFLNKHYVLSAYLVHKRTSDELFERMKNKGFLPSDVTCEKIKEKLKEDGDGDVATTSLRVSLNCPLGKIRMIAPCRAKSCAHLQCFDAKLYLQMNEKKPKWKCPVCNKVLLYEDLVIDEYFLNAISALNDDTNEIQLNKDGTWTKLEEDMQANKEVTTSIADSIQIDDSDDDDKIVNDDDQNNNNVEQPLKIKIVSDHLNKNKKMKLENVEAVVKDKETVDLTLDDD